MVLTKKSNLKGEITVPGDKSISHRSIMLASLAFGTTEVTGFLESADCLSSIACFLKMGVQIENSRSTNTVLIHGKGLHELYPPKTILDMGNSGTTTRLMSGILAAQNFTSMLTGDASLQKRPMDRIIEPLTLMGAKFESLINNNHIPYTVAGGNLKGIEYVSPIASAQVKSAILLAGLYAESETKIMQPQLSRNHTELMFKTFDIPVQIENAAVIIKPTEKFYGQKINIPGDISSAAYFIAAGLITPNSEITLKNVGINPTRDGIISVCKLMGGDIMSTNVGHDANEPTADITVKTSSLNGITIEGAMIPRLIDEIPIIAVLACFATGTTIIKDAAELKVKESNRIDVMVHNLKAMGADIEATEDGMVIHGGKPLTGNNIESMSDHRIAMSLAIAALNAGGETNIKKAECVTVSYPNFYKDMASLYE